MGIATVCAIILLPWWISQDVSVARAEYNTAYLYGEVGITKVADILDKQLLDGRLMISSKDIAYYMDYRYRYRVLGTVCEQRDLASVLMDQEVKALVYREGQWIDKVTGPCLRSEAVQQILSSDFSQDKAGDFTVWVRRGKQRLEAEPCQ